MFNIQSYTDYRELLEATRTIAVVGLSPKEARPSNMVARYLIAAGYRVFPVNPGQDTILGLPCYGELSDLPEAVDLVNIFRRSEEVFPIVKDAVRLGAKAIWMQQGIVHREAEAFARQHGLQVIMDRCIKVDHQHLFPVSR